MAEIDIPSNERSRRTRQALLDAARAILEEEGFDALTMAAVALRAGVSRRAVYLHFDSVAALIGGLFQHVADVEGLESSVAALWQVPDPVSALEAWVRHLADYHPRVMTVDQALARVESSDEAAAAHRARVNAAQMENCERVARWLADEGSLADGWDATSAADLMYGLVSSELMTRLLRQRGWSREQLGDRLGAILRAGLTRDRGR